MFYAIWSLLEQLNFFDNMRNLNNKNNNMYNITGAEELQHCVLFIHRLSLTKTQATVYAYTQKDCKQ